ncbi:tropomyosin-like [Ochlerotatus camptorhynchus]|uniref:tropomyosin-like n=1 Tax=Ochlerotatus camptorhynchus TaxID=644619 RepID=UPI0031D22B23
MDDQEFQLARNDFDLDAIRNRLINCICELQSRRNEVNSLKSALDDSNRAKATLEQDAKNFNRELTDLRDQLKIALDALNQKDSIRNGFMENAARQNVQLEALTNDNERLQAKMQASQVKIMELTRDNNKLRDQMKVLQGTQNQPGETADRIWKAMDTLNSHLQKLEAEHVVLSETAESSNKLAEEAAVAVANSKSSLMKMQSDSIVFMRRIVDLEAKLLSISSKTDGNGAAENEEDSYVKFEEHLKVINGELEQEREANVKLRADISSLLALQDCLTKQLDVAVNPCNNNSSNEPIEKHSKSTDVESMEASS